MNPDREMPVPGPARASGLALWGGLVSVVSVAACVVSTLLTLFVTPYAAAAVLALPLVSFGGAALSYLGLREIRRSNGALMGRPAGLAGLFIGISAGILQSAAALSALGSAMAVRQDLAPVVEAFMLAGSRHERAATRATLGERVASHVTDERLDWFFGEVESRLGAPTGARFNLGVMIRAGRQLAEAAAGVAPGKTVMENPKPLELVCARGRSIMYVMPDDDTMRSRQRVAISDVLVMLPDGGTLPLRAEGPAAALARRLGWRLVEAPAAP